MLSIKEIRRYANNQSYARGQAYYNGHRVTVKDITTEQTPKGELTRITAQAHGSFGAVYKTELCLTKDDEIESYDCDCPYGFMGMCKHAVAAGLLYRDWQQRMGRERPSRGDITDKGPRTSAPLSQLLSDYAAQIRADKPGSPLRIEPQFSSRDGEVTLEVKIGQSRMYVVKNLVKLVRDIYLRRETTYGTTYTVRHSPEALDDESLSLYEALRMALSQRYTDLYHPNRYRYDEANDLRNLTVYGADAERILGLYLGKTIMFNGRTTPVVDGNPAFVFKLESKVRSAVLSGPSIELYEGPDRAFCYFEGRLWHLTADFVRRVGPLMRLFRRTHLSYGTDQTYTLSEADYMSFCGNVLPALAGLCEVRTVGDIDLSAWTPPEPVLAMQIRFEADDLLAATATVTYGSDTYDLLSDKERPSGWRDPAEDEARRLIETYFPEDGGADAGTGAYRASLWSAEDDEEAAEADDEKEDAPISPRGRAVRLARGDNQLWTLADEGLQKLSEVMDVYVDDRLKAMRMRPAPPVSIGVSLSGGVLELTFSTDQMSPEEVAGILNSYRERRRYHRLRGGEFLTLTDGGLQTLSELYEGLHLSEGALKKGRVSLPAYRALYVDDVLAASQSVRYDRSPDFRGMVRTVRDFHNGAYSLPAQVHAELRPYQMDGFQWLCSLYDLNMGGILADDMGLGKTLEMIALMRHAWEADPGFTALVVAPASLLYNWESELRSFAPDMTSQIIAGTAAERAALIGECSRYQVNITSYDLLKRDIDHYEGLRFSLAVVDEAQYVKNASTKAAKSLERLDAAHRFAMTGTPVENRLSDLWSIFNFVMPGYLYDYQAFKRNLETPIAHDDAVARERLTRMVRPFLLRRKKADVLKDLPDKLEENMYVRLEGEQDALYRAHRDRLLQQLSGIDDEALKRDRIRVLAALTRLRQICCSPALCFEAYAGPSAKIDACMELLRSATGAGHRVLVFSQFTSMLELLIAQWKEPYFYLSGADSKARRQEMVEAFQRGDAPVFFISLKAGGTGLNLTAADVVIHCDPWWNVAAQNQATDRAHRIGQKNPVNVVRLVARDTIEERIIDLQARKAALADAVVQGGEGFTLNRDELISLISERAEG